LDLVRAWDPEGDDLAAKSRELILLMLEQTDAPFSRDQFTPGHITATSVVLHPASNEVLLIHHARLNRWLLPGGHVEPDDATLADAAAREALEETGVSVGITLGLAGMDVHGIPPKRKDGRLVEPYHLHHDLIFAFQAASVETAVSEESRDVRWASPAEFAHYAIPEPIRRAVARAQ
jgi:8-oxo-dGTP pyrophosphatase MutT (NUDIX family)